MSNKNIWYRREGFWYSVMGVVATIIAAVITVQCATNSPIPQNENQNQSGGTNIQGNNINSSNQSGGFNGINTGILNLGKTPLTISPEQKSQVISILKKYPAFTVRVLSSDSNNENRLGFELVNLLRTNGIEAWKSTTMGFPYPAGVSVWGFNSDGLQAAKELKDTLSPTGLKIDLRPIEKDKNETLTILLGED